jgi:hypothetical protein
VKSLCHDVLGPAEQFAESPVDVRADHGESCTKHLDELIVALVQRIHVGHWRKGEPTLVELRLYGMPRRHHLAKRSGQCDRAGIQRREAARRAADKQADVV